MKRRGFIVGGVAVVTGGAVFAGRWYNVAGELTEGTLSVEAAHKAATGGDVFLIDIRRPDEWQRTGIGEGAYPLDMRRSDFTTALMEITGGNADAPIALICARGVRSHRMSLALMQAGFTRIIDVPEGMLGSGAGAGWLRKGLPVRAPKEGET